MPMDASTDDKWASPWSNDGSRAMQLSLVRSKAAVDQLDAEEKSKMASPFHPAFVHQIFGESEVIVRESSTSEGHVDLAKRMWAVWLSETQH